MEARLFAEGTVPDFTTPEFFHSYPWIAPAHQLGHAQRTAMVAALVRTTYETYPFSSLSDLGCGDGSLLSAVATLPVPMWGYDAGVGNVVQAARASLDVRTADFLCEPIEYGELVIASEVIEHLLDPHTFVSEVPSRLMILSSPSAETADWHYEHHAWAWDIDGYRELATQCGWVVVRHDECEAEVNHHGGQTRPQRFQAMLLSRDG